MITVNLEGYGQVSKYRLRTCNYDIERWNYVDSLHSTHEGHRTMWFFGECGNRDECVVTRGDDMDEWQGEVMAFHHFTEASIRY